MDNDVLVLHHFTSIVRQAGNDENFAAVYYLFFGQVACCHVSDTPASIDYFVGILVAVVERFIFMVIGKTKDAVGGLPATRFIIGRTVRFPIICHKSIILSIPPLTMLRPVPPEHL